MRNWNISQLSVFSRKVSFVGYLWGIETTSSFLLAWEWKVEFVGYLWGIETGIVIIISSWIDAFVGYLWGIETPKWNKLTLNLWKVCRLPMRNWNDVEDHELEEEEIVCRLPMRNWNDDRSCSSCSAWSLFVGYLWGIETTSSLTPIQRDDALFVGYLWGIETIEAEVEEVERERVCRLPMRNWNWSMRWGYGVEKGFVGYLWGIETGIDKVNGNKIPEVCRLPMRNWNFDW